MVDPLVLDDVAVLKKIMDNSSTLPSSNPVWESCVFPMCEQQILLSFFSVHPHLIKQSRAKNTILDKTLTSTLFSVTLLDRRKSSLLYLKKACLERGPYVTDENNRILYKKDVTLVNISNT